ncbi:MAG TPA: FAD-binding oxidoreductase [Gaiellaceae bacterium]|nr:FAD-binding oxidoreductase [Gaiellaceae bacterium]
MTVLDLEGLDVLSNDFAGALIAPSDDGYEEARRVHNGLIDKRPALIARCRGTADVVAAVRFARGAGLEISVRGGGHSVSGLAATDGGVMIDLAELKGVHVDPVAQTVRAQGGVTWGELNRETAIHGLATTGGVVSTTGIAGLTLGGGLGWLNGVYGLAVDNLLALELVTANGDVLLVSDDTHPDLFWALRGGGGNFGVATWFEYRLHPLREVYGGLIAYPFAAAADVLRTFREFDQPDELWIVVGLVHAPDGSGAKLAAFVVCHVGEQERAEADVNRLLERTGAPVLSELGSMPYPVVNTFFDESYPRGALNYWKSSFLSDLGDEVIDTLIERFAAAPSPMSAMVLEYFHGAVCRVGVSETAVPHRHPGYNLGIFAEWLDSAETEENISWTRATYDALEPHRAALRYVNYLSDDDVGAAVRAAYGPNYERLVEMKRRYDPDNVFHLNHNIDPGRANDTPAA